MYEAKLLKQLQDRGRRYPRPRIRKIAVRRSKYRNKFECACCDTVVQMHACACYSNTSNE